MKKRNIINAIPNFPFLESTIDGLSYYQLLAGLNEYINECVDLINSTGIEDWKNQIDIVNGKINTITNNVSNLTNRISTIESTVGSSALNTSAKDLTSAVNELLTLINANTVKIGVESLNTSASDLSGAINELLESVVAINDKSTLNTQNITSLNSKVTTLESSVADNSKAITVHDGMITELEGTVNDLNNSVKSVESLVSSNTQAISDKIGSETLQTAAQTLTGAINELKQTGGGSTGEKTPVTSDTTVTTVGKSAVDAVQLNPNYTDSLASKLIYNTNSIKSVESAIGNDNLATSSDTLIGAINEIVTDITDLEENNNDIKNKIGDSSLQTVEQTLTGAINELKQTGGSIGEKTPVTSETTVTIAGSTAVDAVQLNPNYNNSLASKVKANTDIIGNKDISSIADGTITGNLNTLNSNVILNIASNLILEVNNKICILTFNGYDVTSSNENFDSLNNLIPSEYFPSRNYSYCNIFALYNNKYYTVFSQLSTSGKWIGYGISTSVDGYIYLNGKSTWFGTIVWIR